MPDGYCGRGRPAIAEPMYAQWCQSKCGGIYSRSTEVPYRMNRIIFVTVLCLFYLPLSAQNQTSQKESDYHYGHGTCATALLGPIGAAFIIDSRITVTQTTPDGKEAVSHHEGCKVVLAKPTILIAGIGLEYDQNQLGNWKILDEAKKALSSLPEHFSERDLDTWGTAWATTLRNHYRFANKVPSPALCPMTSKDNPCVVAETLLITRVDEQPYLRRTAVAWDGQLFQYWIDGQDIDKLHPYLNYSGSCRAFVTHDSGHGYSIPARYRTVAEREEMDEIAIKARSGTTAQDLATAVLGLEEVLNRIDIRVYGNGDEDRALVAPPYATAQWMQGEKEWTTQFNPACSPKPAIAKGITPKAKAKKSQ